MTQPPEKYHQRIRMKIKQCMVDEIKAIQAESTSNELLPHLKSQDIILAGLAFTIDFMKYINDAFGDEFNQPPSKVFMRELRAKFGHDK